MRIRRLIAGCLALGAALTLPVRLTADGPKTRYERVLAQEDELRLGRRPSPLSQIRHVVAEYEAIVRRYPTSGYSDNALWQAAGLSLRANQIYRSEIDRETAVRMLRWLVEQYPASSLRPKAKRLLRQTHSAETTVASMRTPTGAKPAAPMMSMAAPTPAPSRAPTLSPTLSSTRSVSESDLPETLSAARSETSSRPVMLKSVKRTVIDDLVRVTIEFDGEVAYTQDRIDGPSRLFFDMKRTTTPPALRDATLTYSDESVRHIRLGRPRPDITRLVIDLTGTDTYSVFALYNPYRLTIDLHRAKTQQTMLAARNLHSQQAQLVTTRLVSAEITRDVEADRRLQPRPLPHPLARVPTAPQLSSRRVARAVAPAPLVPNRTLLPLTALPVHNIASVHVAAAFVAKPAIAAAPAAIAASALATHEKPRSETPSTRRRRLTEIARETPPPPPAVKSPAGADVADGVAGASSVVPAAGATLPPPAAPSANNGGNYSIARQLGLGVSRIVIDPGHGGHDPGALGSKINESEIVLDVALRLEKLLQNERNFDVVLTRRTDVFIPLEERTAIANREHADLFLSIHVNSSRNKQAHGIETYHLNFASNPEAEAVAARENAGAAQTMNHLPEIVKAIALNNKLDESRDFAHMVQESMVGRLKAQNAAMKDLGVKQAPFVVLIGAGMPSVLAEIAFISNSNEATLLKTGAYREKIAEALFDAVKKYQKTLKSIGTVVSQATTFDDRN
jgi:N-acetylmuramoyl-L-alanine amidase